jgi:hypothetical protein
MRWLPAAAGMLAALAFIDAAFPSSAPGWAAWLALAGGAVAGEITRRLWLW